MAKSGSLGSTQRLLAVLARLLLLSYSYSTAHIKQGEKDKRGILQISAFKRYA
jgi:hypothetical protein